MKDQNCTINLVYVTHENETNARSLVSSILNKKLAACANTFPITASYWWEGKVVHGGEVVSILKTLPDLWEPLKEAILKIHPYEVPCIMKLETQVNESYYNWIKESVAVS